MGLFGRRKKDLTESGVPGTAVVKDVGDEQHPHTDKDDFHISELGLGNVLYPMELEVTVDGKAPYTVKDTFKVPAKITNWDVGTRIPVYVDPADPTKIDLNWDQFVASGANKAPEWTPERAHAGMPDASRQMMVSGWVAAANGGQMSRKDFDKAIDGAVEGGMLTAAEGDAAKAQLA